MIFSGILAFTMFAISTVAIQAQIAFTLDTSAMVVGTTTIDNVDVSYTGSQDALTGVRIDYEQGSSVGTNYLSMPSSGFLFTDTGNGSFNFNIPGLISGQLYTIRAIYCGFGVVTTCPGTIGTFSVTTLGPPTITSPPSNVTVSVLRSLCRRISLGQTSSVIKCLLKSQIARCRSRANRSRPFPARGR